VDQEGIREHARMREMEYMDTICNTMDGVFIVDVNNHIIRWNKGAEKILGHSEAEVLNRNCFQVVSGKASPEKAHCSQECRIYSNGLKGVPQNNYDLLIQPDSGNPRWINITILSSADFGGQPFIAHIFRDVTREKKTALALDQFLAKLGTSPLPMEDSDEKPGSKLSPPAIDPAIDKPSVSLSGREIEVLTLLAEGLSTKGLAQKLSISPFTARNHIQNILVKLNLHSKAQAVSYAFKRGLL
jgi:PAS domain S-box-containing protein